MENYLVTYIVEIEGLQHQAFRCAADDAEHAEEQCQDAYPTADIVWVQGPGDVANGEWIDPIQMPTRVGGAAHDPHR